MKRSIVLLLGLVGVLAAQNWKVRLIPAPPTQFFIEQMWNCQISNTEAKPVDVTLYGWITKNGKEIAHARSNVITIPSRGKRITSADVNRVQDDWYDPDYEDVVNRHGALPAGNYRYCLQVELARGDTILAQDCAERRGIKSSPPRLLTPQDGAELTNPQPVFVWIPPVPPSKGLTYRLRIVKVPEHMTPDEAIPAAEPWFEEKGINTPSFLYPMSARPFEEGIKYAWRITAWTGIWEIAQSDIYSFTFGKIEEGDTTAVEEPEKLEEE